MTARTAPLSLNCVSVSLSFSNPPSLSTTPVVLLQHVGSKQLAIRSVMKPLLRTIFELDMSPTIQNAMTKWECAAWTKFYIRWTLLSMLALQTIYPHLLNDLVPICPWIWCPLHTNDQCDQISVFASHKKSAKLKVKTKIMQNNSTSSTNFRRVLDRHKRGGGARPVLHRQRPQAYFHLTFNT